METSIVRTDHTMKEIERHGTDDYPIMISSRLTLPLNMGIVSWHWHDDFELTYLESGYFQFSVGSDTFLLSPGEAVFINSKILHQVKPARNTAPVYHSYAFAPELISESMGSLIAVKYLLPIMGNQRFPYYIFHKDSGWEEQCIAHIKELNSASASQDFVREFQIQNYLRTVFIDMIHHLPGICTQSATPPDNGNLSIKKIMLYIKNHYSEALTLADMADAANLSKSSCNRLFHKTLKMTPFEYLLDFRLNQSMQLLITSTQSITGIAYSCGFHDASYYCKTFRKYTGISPQAYRRLRQDDAIVI